MAFTLTPPLGNPVTVSSAKRRDALLARGWSLVQPEAPAPESEPEEKPSPKRTKRTPTPKSD